MISEAVLKKYHATVVVLNKGEILFQEGDIAGFFHIVKSGKIKMANYNTDGREFVQGYFTEGESFGEPPFFSRQPFPASAVAVEKSEVWKISYDEFMKLLERNFNVHFELTQALSDRLMYKAKMLSELAMEEAEHRLTTLIEYLIAHNGKGKKSPLKLTLTRQQLADMTGLRVETVIRSIKLLEQKQLLEIDEDGKIIWKHSSRKKQNPPAE